MPRNLDTRVELLTPIRDPSLRADLVDTLDRCFADNTNSWELSTDGEWMRRTPGDDEPRNVQRELMAAHAAAAAEASAQQPQDASRRARSSRAAPGGDAACRRRRSAGTRWPGPTSW